MFKFLNVKPEIFGIDINDLSLRIVKLQKRGSSFRLVSYNDVDIPAGIVKEGVIQNEDSLAKIIVEASKNVNGKRLDTEYVVVSLPEEKSFSQVIQMPRMSEKELRLAVPFEAENYIPLPINKVYIDFQVIETKEKNPNHLDILINVMPKPIVDSYISCFKKAGLTPCILEVESQAIVRAFTKNGKMENPVIFVDFGETKTSLIIYAENSIRFTVTLSISSTQLTEAISQKMGLSFNQAEKIKFKNGFDPKNNDTFEILRPIIKKLSIEIKKYIDFYKGHSSHDYFPANSNIEKIILCGGGSNLNGIGDFLFKELGIKTEIGDPFFNISKKYKFFPEKRALSFTTAIGSALRGVSDTYLNSYSDNK